MRREFLIAAIFASCISGTPAPAANLAHIAPPSVSPITARVRQSISEGRDYFDQKAYHAAEEAFERAAEIDPTCAQAQYWLGCARMRLQDPQGAHEAYENAFRLDPFGESGTKAKNAMIEAAATAAATAAAKQQRPVDSEAEMRAALKRIQQDTNGAIQTKVKFGKQSAHNRKDTTRIAQRKLAAKRHHYGRTVDYMLDTEYERASGAVESLHDLKDCVARANSIQDSANRLYQELSEKPKPGAPHLRAFGTNLYVRYYGTDQPDGNGVPPVDPPLKAQAKPYTVQKN